MELSSVAGGICGDRERGGVEALAGGRGAVGPLARLACPPLPLITDRRLSALDADRERCGVIDVDRLACGLSCNRERDDCRVHGQRRHLGNDARTVSVGHDAAVLAAVLGLVRRRGQGGGVEALAGCRRALCPIGGAGVSPLPLIDQVLPRRLDGERRLLTNCNGNVNGLGNDCQLIRLRLRLNCFNELEVHAQTTRVITDTNDSNRRGTHRIVVLVTVQVIGSTDKLDTAQIHIGKGLDVGSAVHEGVSTELKRGVSNVVGRSHIDIALKH